MCIYIYIYIYTYVYNLRTKTLYFRGFDSSRVLISRGGILMSIGNFRQSLSQQISTGIIFSREIGRTPSSEFTEASGDVCRSNRKARSLKVFAESHVLPLIHVDFCRNQSPCSVLEHSEGRMDARVRADLLESAPMMQDCARRLARRYAELAR